MGRRRRKIIKKIPKPPPRVFVCPLCGAQAVSVTHEPAEAEVATVSCANCKASAQVKWYPAYTDVDAYSEWYDIVTKEASEAETGKS